jgi:hypothetical protein
VFHPPISLAETIVIGQSEEQDREVCRRLTVEINRQLHQVIYATEDWETHALFHRARSLIRAERACRSGVQLGQVDMKEKVAGLARIWTGYQVRIQSHPAEVEVLSDQLRQYDAELQALGLKDHELDRPPLSLTMKLLLLLVLQSLAVFFLLPPLLLTGYLINGPPALLLSAIVGAVGSEEKDAATLKMLGGLVLFPLTWGLWAGGVFFGTIQLDAFFPSFPKAPYLAALATLLLGFVGGWVALVYLQFAKETWRVLRVRLTRKMWRAATRRLRAQRAVLHDQLIGLSEGIELPGVAEEGGRIRAASD